MLFAYTVYYKYSKLNCNYTGANWIWKLIKNLWFLVKKTVDWLFKHLDCIWHCFVETMTEVEMQEFFDEFYEEVFTECEDKVKFYLSEFFYINSN